MIRRRTLLFGAVALVAIMALVTAGDAIAGKKNRKMYTSRFPIGDCAALVNSAAAGAQNRFFPLEIGRVWELSNQACVDDGDCDELEEVRISVLDETEMVDGVVTRVVEEREWVDGAIEEVSRNFYVECLGTGDVYYYGEDVLDGDGNPLPDGWRSGVDGASPGMIFPGGAFLLGARYFQEVAPGIALDRGEHMAMGIGFDSPAGAFSDCVLVLDTNAIEDPRGRRGDEKVYCPGVGMVLDEELELINFVDP